MWTRGETGTFRPAHVWPINVSLCWGGLVILRGEHLDMFFLVLCGCCHCSAWSVSGFHLLPLHCIPAFSLLTAPADWYLDPPSVRTFSHVAADGGKTSRFSFFGFALAHILRTATIFFSILVVSAERQFSENCEAFSEHKIQPF